MRSTDLPAWDETLAAHFDGGRVAERDMERAQWFEEHDRYLNTDVWLDKRAAVLRRANGLCEGCGAAKATQVHHLTYEHWREELLWELVAICTDCHERVHSKRKVMVIGVREPHSERELGRFA